MKRISLLVAALALTLVPGVSAACSPEPDYRVPSNLALTGMAETIVLARVTGQHQDERGRPTAVVITPLAAVKGELPQGDIAIGGTSLADGRARGEYAALSNPFEFEKPHPQSWAGACIRTAFPLGTTALFFLRTDHEGMWAPAAEPFSRWAEDVPDADAPWVQLVRLYTIAAGLPEADRAAFLEDEREALLARTGEPLARLMADDIARQLGGAEAAPDDASGLAFREPGEESAVEAALKAMRQDAVEAGN
jgi:hypothetical protein